MRKKSTIDPVLTPLKAYYTTLSKEEQTAFDSLSNESLTHELELLSVLSSLPKKQLNPSPSSINIILDYSKKGSKQGYVC